MTFSWNYPIFLIPHGGGYASIVDPEDTNRQLLVVFTKEEPALAFFVEFNILGRPRALKNSREFAWLLQSLQEPVTRVAFDPKPAQGEVNAAWTVAVATLLNHHLAVDFSPWNYPSFVIAEESGFASIEGQSSDGRPLTAVGVFTSADKARDYLSATDSKGTLCELKNVDEARRFLESLDVNVFAVALDPTVKDGQHTAKHCFDIATLLEKYLVNDQ
jgi:hypothetical protein